MFRKTLLAWLLLLFSTGSFANIYIGGGLGPEVADFHQAAKFIQSGNANVNDNEHHAAFGYFGTIFLGYERDCEDKNLLIHLAGEINADITEVEFHSDNNEFLHRTFSSTSYKLRYSLGASVLPGFWFENNTLFYARLGFAVSRFRVNTGDDSLQNLERDIKGFRYGLGFERILCHGLSIRGEYNRTEYQNTRMFRQNPFFTKKTVISPVTAEVIFAIVYRFC